MHFVSRNLLICLSRRRDPERERFVRAGPVPRRGHRHLQEHQGGHRQDNRRTPRHQQRQQTVSFRQSFGFGFSFPGGPPDIN